MDAYESWALFLIFCSILILVSGVVLLTNKKPDQHPHTPGIASGDPTSLVALPRGARRRARSGAGKPPGDEESGIIDSEDEDHQGTTAPWQLGDDSDDEEDHVGRSAPASARRSERTWAEGEGERARMMDDIDADEPGHRESTSSDATLARPDTDDLKDWERRKDSS